MEQAPANSTIERYRWLLRYGPDDDRAHQVLLELLAEEEAKTTAAVKKSEDCSNTSRLPSRPGTVRATVGLRWRPRRMALMAFLRGLLRKLLDRLARQRRSV